MVFVKCMIYLCSGMLYSLLNLIPCSIHNLLNIRSECFCCLGFSLFLATFMSFVGVDFFLETTFIDIALFPLFIHFVIIEDIWNLLW